MRANFFKGSFYQRKKFNLNYVPHLYIVIVIFFNKLKVG